MSHSFILSIGCPSNVPTSSLECRAREADPLRALLYKLSGCLARRREAVPGFPAETSPGMILELPVTGNKVHETCSRIILRPQRILHLDPSTARAESPDSPKRNPRIAESSKSHETCLCLAVKSCRSRAATDVRRGSGIEGAHPADTSSNSMCEHLLMFSDIIALVALDRGQSLFAIATTSTVLLPLNTSA